MLGAHQDSGRARLELVREDRVGAHKDSARAHLESGGDGAYYNDSAGAGTPRVRQGGRDAGTPGVGQGRSP